MSQQTNKQQITLGAGCFWCVEAIFEQVNGVEKVESGYMGGHTINPSYKEVCSGSTGHAEVCQLTYDPLVVSIDKILEIYWQTHDPTQLNRQGNDRGTQYRSVIFYHTSEQQEKAEQYKQKLDSEGIWDKPIVTQIDPATTFYPAEDYHQDYYNLNPQNQYCRYVITPKIEKFKKVFSDMLK